MIPKNLRCGTAVKTAKGWFNVVKIWNSNGEVNKVTLEVRGKQTTVDAIKLCEHIVETKVI